MQVVTLKSKQSVYHHLGQEVRYASAETHQSPCGWLWYYEHENWRTEIIDHIIAESRGKRPCLSCFPSRYTRRDTTHDRGVGYDDYTRNLAWQ